MTIESSTTPPHQPPTTTSEQPTALSLPNKDKPYYREAILFLIRLLLLLVHYTTRALRYLIGAFSLASRDGSLPTARPVQTTVRSCCVIGGGPSGLAAIKHLTVDYADDFNTDDCVLFESRSEIGGIWNFEGDTASANDELTDMSDDLTPMYETLHTNTSKRLMTFTDFPMPEHYPDYPSQQQVQDYLLEYVNRFDLRRHIQLNTRVVRVEKRTGGDSNSPKWVVTTRRTGDDDSGQEQMHEFDAIFVCNGHLSAPHMPPGFDKFSAVYKRGKFIHSKQFNSSRPFRGKSVAVVGVGSSGADIAAKVAPIARETIISIRPTANVRPKYVWGMPIDLVTPRRIMLLLPAPVRRLLNKLLITWHLPNFGTHLNSMESANATGGLSTELLQQIGDGMVSVRREIERVDKDRIYFKDGSSAQPHYVICSTGYEPHFPFFNTVDPNGGSNGSSLGKREHSQPGRSSKMKTIRIDRANGRVLDLYKHVFHIDDPTCCFIGIPNRIKPFPVADLQVRWCCEVLSGRRQLPSKEAMQADNVKKEQQMRKAGIELRFWHRVNHVAYCDELSKFAGCYPDMTSWDNSDLLIPLLLWPLYPTCYRLSGTKNGGVLAREWFLSQACGK